jgi:hypothetical protein
MGTNMRRQFTNDPCKLHPTSVAEWWAQDAPQKKGIILIELHVL